MAGNRVRQIATKAISKPHGVEEGNWFLSMHCLTKNVKVAFFRGAMLDPIPLEASKQKDVRYFHVHEGDDLNKSRFARWVKQASKLPGEKM